MKTFAVATLVSAFSLSCAGSSNPPADTSSTSSSTSSSSTDQPSSSSSSTGQPSANSTLLVSDVNWTPLNPAKGDASPKAATLWGDRNAEVPTGFLVKFVDGFSSPPHIHNVSYRGVVIDGLVHNDDPAAENLWLPAGSYWTQPAGGVHITSAQGQYNVALIEINQGPYLVKPVEEAFDNGETMIRVPNSDVAWVDVPGAANVKKVHLWNASADGSVKGTLLRLPKGFSGAVDTNSPSFQAVVIQGGVVYDRANDGNTQTLAPGSMFSSTGTSKHRIVRCDQADCVIYIRSNDQFSVSAS